MLPAAITNIHQAFREIKHMQLELQFRQYRGLDESGRLDLGLQKWAKVNLGYEG
jgi:hypothetical protein